MPPLAADAPQPLLFSCAEVLLAMDSITALLDSLPRHFGSLTLTVAAARDAQSSMAQLRALVLAGGNRSTDAAGLDR